MDVGSVISDKIQHVRAEINNRTDYSEKIVLAEITALGLAVSWPEKAGDALLGLSAVSSLLWLFWLAHSHQIYKLASYLACELAPRLCQHSGEQVPDWEEYSRIMDRAGPEAYKSSYPPPYSSVTKPALWNAAGFVLWLFAGATPALLVVYVFVAWNKKFMTFHAGNISLDLTRIAMGILSLAIWVFAISQYRRVAGIRKAIDERVVQLAYSGNGGNKESKSREENSGHCFSVSSATVASNVELRGNKRPVVAGRF